jgi:hypothetical protein
MPEQHFGARHVGPLRREVGLGRAQRLHGVLVVLLADGFDPC